MTTIEWTEKMKKLLAGAAQAQAAAIDMIEAARAGEIHPADNIGDGDTTTILADGLRLLIEAAGDEDENANQLHGVLVKFLEVRG